ncbi:MAG: BamA/TamA family outer membrane protein [Cyclobacteriaceae bacterium]|nr:BamA/TamA family outer membrane protein [Cyclobacteriaceae bacterium]
MRRTIVLMLMLACGFSSLAQFRKSREKAVTTPETTATESQPSPSNPSEYFIAGIEVAGLNVLDKNAMISLTGLKIGDKIKIPGDQIATAIRKLWKHGLVGDVTISVDRVEDKNAYLVITLAERPRLNDFYFRGITRARESSLKEDMKLIKGKIVNDAMIRNTELSVKKFFAKKGFLNTTVNIVPEQDSLTRGGVRLRIDIDLKKKVRINEIIFEGNKEISSTQLKKKMKKTHEHARISLHRTILGAVLGTPPSRYKAALDSSRKLSWREIKSFINDNVKLNVFNGSKFIKADFEEDKKKIVEYFNTQGYRDADILSDTIVRHSDNSIDIRFKVYEGRKYYFRNIIWTGNYIHTATTLNKILDIKKGDVYNNELLTKKTSFNPKGADISGLYMDDGYLFFRVTPVEVAIVGDSIDIEMRMFEGEQATIDQVIISGNERTSDHVIRRELSTIPGQKFRRSDIIRTQQMLSSMGYFNPQKIEQDVRPNPANGTVDIEWKLQEQSNDQIQLSGGWGGFYGFVGTVGLTFNNFSMRNVPHLKKWRPLPVGDGQRLSLQAQANGKSFQSYSLSFTEPWLGGKKPNSFTVSLTHSISRRPNSNFEFTNDFSLRQSGVTLSLGRRLEWPDNYFTLSNALSFLVYNYNNFLFGSTSLPAVGQTNSFTFNTTLSRNSIDNPMFPTQGSSISLSLSLTPPYSLLRDQSYIKDVNERYRWLELHKWMMDAKFYLKLLGSSKPTGRSLVLEARAHFGFIGTYSKALTPGPFERFYVGGAGLAGGFNSFVLGQEIVGLRGYPDNSVTPPLYARRTSGQQATSIEGGIVYDKFVMELRYPITTSQTATIYTLAFAEAGNNWDNFLDFNPFKSYRSAGVGARIFMPAFGLIGLNWAYGFDTLPGAQQRSGAQFHFTIGQQIR